MSTKAAQGKNVSFADLFSALNPTQHLSSDGFHPNESGYETIANVLLNAITRVTATSNSTGSDTTDNTGSNTGTGDSTGGETGSNTEPPDPTNTEEEEATGYTTRDGDKLFGSSAKDTIIGTSADELFRGGRRRDTLTGGGGSDTFYYGTRGEGRDIITDFGSDDFIRVSASTFRGGLVAGGSLSSTDSASGVLVIGDNPISLGTSGTFLFNTSTQMLSYDKDGLGTRHGANDIAQLTGVATFSASQILITE